MRLLLVVMTPIILVGILVAQPFLALWISPEFAARSALVLQILLIGFWINGVARVPHARLQATGRPKLVAFCHLGEVVPYLAILFIGIQVVGVAGAAVAFTLRVLTDHVLLSALAGTLRSTILLTIYGLVFLGAALLLSQQSFPAPVMALAGLMLLALTIVWSVTHAPDALKQRVRDISKRP